MGIAQIKYLPLERDKVRGKGKELSNQMILKTHQCF